MKPTIQFWRSGGYLQVFAIGMALFGVACSDRQEEAVNELFESDYAFTVEEFLRAASLGDLKAVRWFLGAGMEADVVDIYKTGALHVAAEGGHSEVVSELLDEGADASAVRLDGRTPLMLAAESGDGRSVEMLLDSGCSALQEDPKGWSAMTLAAYGGHGRAVEALVPYSQPHLNRALMLAAMNGNVAAIDPLVSSTAEIDVRSPDDRTPLMLAAARGHDEAVKFLLHHGANWYATDVENRTAAELAAAGGHGDVVNLLDTAHLSDALLNEGDEGFVPEATGDGDDDGDEVLYTSKTRRIEGERLVMGGGGGHELSSVLTMLAYRERQLPIDFDGVIEGERDVAVVRLLFGDHALYQVEQGMVIPETNLEVMAIEKHWSRGKQGQGEPVLSIRMVVRELVSGDVIGVTPGDPGRSAKSYALVRHEGTGQNYQVRRGDLFEVLGVPFRVMDLRSREVLIENLETAEVIRLKRQN